MFLYATTINALDAKTGELKTYGGPNVPGLTPRMAEQYCQENGLGYCTVNPDELVAEIPTKADGLTPDWTKLIDYQTPRLN
jgi:hypothetical protein